MLLAIKSKMTLGEKQRLMEVYEESNLENGREMFPEDLPKTALRKVHEGFSDFLDEFLSDSKHACYVWEEKGMYIAALRMIRVKDFYYMEALETARVFRRKGYGEKLIKGVITYLEKNGPVVIRSAVNKKNENSLALHKKCGFAIDQQEALEYYEEPPVAEPKAYGLVYRNCPAIRGKNTHASHNDIGQQNNLDT